MLNTKLQDAINEQIKNELYSSYLYLAMSAYSESVNLSGVGHWMRVQAREEQEHALKLYRYTIEKGGRVLLQAIDKPPAEFDSALDLFERTLAHEEKVTGLINDLYALAADEKDYATQIFLQWFVTEQVEEEANATRIVELLKAIGDHPQGLIMLDRQLAARGG
jgi:ferritin